MKTIELHRQLVQNGYEHCYSSGPQINGCHEHLTYVNSHSGKQITIFRMDEYSKDYLLEIQYTFGLEFNFSTTHTQQNPRDNQ